MKASRSNFKNCFAVVLLGVLLSAGTKPANAQFPPDSLTNLQVLPEDISVRELIGVMRGFAGGLGVRCQYCHVHEGNQPNNLSTFDFPSDEKETKRKARVMLRMVSQINDGHLASLESRGDPEVRVECATCHRGQTRPRLITDVLNEALADGGVDGLKSKYIELRERYYGSHTYDFRWFIINNIAQSMVRQGNFDDASELAEFNLTFFPEHPNVKRFKTGISIQLAANEGTTVVAELLPQLMEEFGPQVLSEGFLTSVAYGVLRGNAASSVEIFKYIVEQHPDSPNAYDSLGEGYMNNGQTDLAIQNYEKVLEMDPGNTNATEMLERIRSQ